MAKQKTKRVKSKQTVITGSSAKTRRKKSSHQLSANLEGERKSNQKSFLGTLKTLSSFYA